MPIVNGYITAQQVRDQLTDAGGKMSDTLIENAVNAASRAVDRYCGRRFWQDTGLTTRTFTATSRDLALVDDISTRTGLVVATGSDGVNYDAALAIGTDYVLEPRNADKFASANFDAYAFWGIRLVNGTSFYINGDLPTLSVTAQFGWSAVPDEVSQACLLKAVALFKRKDAPFGVAGFGEFGAVRISKADPDVMDLLAGYVIAGV